MPPRLYPRRLALSLLAAISAGVALAQLTPEDDSTCPGWYAGGWALRVNAASCPPSAPVFCGKGAQPRCCPSGTECTGEGDYVGNYCCAPGKDCTQLALSKPKCPDSDWTLWGVDGNLDNGGWCCLDGFTGTYWPNSKSLSVGCVKAEPDTPLSTTQSWAETVAVSTATPCSTFTSTTSRSTTSSSTTSGSITSNADVDAVASPSSGSDSSSSNGSLPAGAIAGIVIAVIGGVGLVAVGLWFWRHQSRQNHDAVAGAMVGATNSTTTNTPKSASQTLVGVTPTPVEADSKPRDQPVELE